MSTPAFFRNKQSISIVFHVLMWAILFAIPYLLSPNDVPRFSVVVKRSWLPVVFSAIIFYLNYFLLVDKLLFRKRIGGFILTNIGLVIISFFLNICIKDLFPPTYDTALTDSVSLSRLARTRELARYSNVISFVLSVVLSVALKMTRRWIRIEAEKQESDKLRLEAELLHLQYQLQPHFFFNSLNNIYALIDKSPEVAKNAVHGLGKLMRYLLYEINNEKMSLATEINFLVKYIQLMELRLSKNITVKYDFPNDGSAYQVAPLLFIPLVENAFKHGIPPTSDAEVFFKMEVSRHQLVFTTRNQNVPKDNLDRTSSGIGLDNLRKRLELMYPGQHRFSAGLENKCFITVLVLNFT